jgi:hypothetical protein
VHVSRAPGLIGSGEGSSEMPRGLSGPGLRFRGTGAERTLHPTLIEVQPPRVIEPQQGLGRSAVREGMPPRVLETPSFPHAVPLEREVLAYGHGSPAARCLRARGGGQRSGRALRALANAVERERVSNQGFALPGVRAHDGLPASGQAQEGACMRIKVLQRAGP